MIVFSLVTLCNCTDQSWVEWVEVKSFLQGVVPVHGIFISKLSKDFIKHPSDLFSVGDIVDCYVDDIYLEKNKVSLSLLEK